MYDSLSFSNPSTIQRLNLIRTLNRLPDSQFEELIFSLQPPAGIVPPATAALGNRTYSLLQWAESPGGPGLSTVQEVLDIVVAGRPDIGHDTAPPSRSEHKSFVSSATKEEVPVPRYPLSVPQSLIKLTESKRDWSDAPLVSSSVGRSKELNTLENWIFEDCCQLVAIVGVAGIGKTNVSARFSQGGVGKSDLSFRLAQSIENKFDYVIWRRLINAPTFEETITELIHFLSDWQEVVLPETLDGQLKQLVYYLRLKRCLLIFDNFESILDKGSFVGKFREGFEKYKKLLQYVGETSNQSCLIITSREKPEEVSRLEEIGAPVRTLELEGLDVSEGKQLFKSLGDFSGTDTELSRLIKFYNGNPLALKLVAKHVECVFDGKLSGFLEKGHPVFSRIEEVLSWHFERLSQKEEEIMLWLAINHNPVLLNELKEDILEPQNKDCCPETLQSLIERFLVEKNHNGFSLQPVLLEYTTERIIRISCEEVKTGKIRFLHSHTLFKAHSNDWVRENQKRIILMPIFDRLILNLGGSKNLEDRLLIMLSESRGSDVAMGYFPGNILNFLSQMGFDMSRKDFSNYCIRQACLRNVRFENVNFSQSLFIKSGFTQSLGSVLSMTPSPHGRFIAVGEASSKISLWQVGNLQQILTYEGHTDWVRAVAFSPDERILASASEDHTVKLWNTKTGECIKTLSQHTDRVRSIAFSPDGSTLVSCDNDCKIRLWTLRSFDCTKVLEGHTAGVRSVAFRPDGNIFASGGEDHTVRLWNFHTGECFKILLNHTDWVWTVVFSPDGKTLASSSFDGTIKLWDAYTGKLKMTLRGHFDQVTQIAFSHDNRILASGSTDCTLRVWKVATGECLGTLRGHVNRVIAVAFSPGSHRLFTGSDDQTIKVWDVYIGKCLRTIYGYTNRPMSISVSNDGKTIASGYENGVVAMFSTSTGDCLKFLQGEPGWIHSIDLSRCGKRLVSCSDIGKIAFWDLNTFQCQKVVKGCVNWILSVIFSSDGNIVVSGGGDSEVKLWCSHTGKCLARLSGHTKLIRSIALSPDGNMIASGSDDHTIKLWKIPDGKCINTLKGHTSRVRSVAFSFDGKILASGSSDHTIRWWNISSGKCTRITNGHLGMVRTVSFSPNNEMLASGSGDRTIRLWDTRTGNCVNTLRGHTGLVMSVAFCKNSLTLVSSSEDETIRVWDLETGDCLRIIRLPRPYENMNISKIMGLTGGQKRTLLGLGAFED